MPRVSHILTSIPSRPLAVRTHQRKHSSSKTPSSPKDPKDESTAITAPSESPATGAKPAPKDGTEKRPSTRLGRRKSKETTHEALGRLRGEAQLSLPSVPSTQHLHPLEIHVASFFSIHRPISLTASFPPVATSNAFSSIFTPQKIQKPNPADVIYTISSAVDNLEDAASRPQNQQNREVTPDEIDLRTVVTEASSSNAGIKHLDGPQPLQINLQDLAQIFRPFVAPPPPVAMGSPEEAVQIAERTQRAKATKQKSYSTVLTILESTHPNGRKTYKTRTSPIREDTTEPMSPSSSQQFEDPSTAVKTTIIEEEEGGKQAPLPRQPFLNRMRIRQQVWEDSSGGKRAREVWIAISVKRQRRLKMKKHKYKKLMRRTRNLRRRLDRN